MSGTRIHFQWSPDGALHRFTTGVSLHSHTLHSRESLDFFYRAAEHSSVLRAAVRRAEMRYQAEYGAALDLGRGWWTPPLAPLDAYSVEAGHIQSLGLAPLVALTDHDDIEAPMSLQAVDATRKVPVSVEWTVPVGETFVHLGVHNLPPLKARSTMTRLREYTAKPCGSALKEILAGLHANPATLIVFNHPLWDEKGVGLAAHRRAVLDLLGQCGEYIHAIEINGLRPWKENRQALLLADTWSKPVISGGDRHALEPSATLNLTRAATFAEFAAEIRSGHGDVLVASHYRQSHARRIVHNVIDVLRTYENHGCGWKDWTDRVFYTFEDGAVQSLSQVWGTGLPPAMAIFDSLIRLAARPSIHQALLAAISRTEEVLP